MNGAFISYCENLKKVLNPPAMVNCKIDKTSRVFSRIELSGIHLGEYSYIGNNCFAVNDDTEKISNIIKKLTEDKGTYQRMKSHADGEGVKVFSYSDIATWSIE